MPTDPSLEAFAALRVASDAFGRTTTDEETIEHRRLEAAFLMADNRYTGTMPTTGAGVAAALEWLFFADEDEALSDCCSPRTQRFVRLLIDAARRLDEPRGKRRVTARRSRPATLPENVVELRPGA